jgi:hypothetical protein
MYVIGEQSSVQFRDYHYNIKPNLFVYYVVCFVNSVRVI